MAVAADYPLATMARKTHALAGLLFLALAGCDNPTEANAPAVEVFDTTQLIGTWETDVNDYKWQIDAVENGVNVHGWDKGSGLAFKVRDIDYNGSLLTFKTHGPGATEPLDHAFRITGDGQMTAHCEGDELGEIDFALTRIPGTGPTLGSGRKGP